MTSVGTYSRSSSSRTDRWVHFQETAVVRVVGTDARSKHQQYFQQNKCFARVHCFNIVPKAALKLTLCIRKVVIQTNIIPDDKINIDTLPVVANVELEN